MRSLWWLLTQPPFCSRDSTGVPQTPGPWTPGNAPACLVSKGGHLGLWDLASGSSRKPAGL